MVIAKGDKATFNRLHSCLKVSLKTKTKKSFPCNIYIQPFLYSGCLWSKQKKNKASSEHFCEREKKLPLQMKGVFTCDAVEQKSACAFLREERFYHLDRKKNNKTLKSNLDIKV